MSSVWMSQLAHRMAARSGGRNRVAVVERRAVGDRHARRARREGQRVVRRVLAVAEMELGEDLAAPVLDPVEDRVPAVVLTREAGGEVRVVPLEEHQVAVVPRHAVVEEHDERHAVRVVPGAVRQALDEVGAVAGDVLGHVGAECTARPGSPAVRRRLADRDAGHARSGERDGRVVVDGELTAVVDPVPEQVGLSDRAADTGEVDRTAAAADARYSSDREVGADDRPRLRDRLRERDAEHEERGESQHDQRPAVGVPCELHIDPPPSRGGGWPRVPVKAPAARVRPNPPAAPPPLGHRRLTLAALRQQVIC